MRPPVGRWLAQAAMAACAGATDLLALATLGGVFASVVTGNLVATGYRLTQADVDPLWVPATAVAAYALGVALWLWLWSARPYALGSQLFVEALLLLTMAAGWLAVDGRPGPLASHVLLAVAATAMGGQSATALRLHAATTYLTGTLTGAVHDLVTGVPGRRVAAIRQLLALLAGAAGAGALLVHLRWSAPILPVLLLAAAAVALRGGVRGGRR